MIASGFTDARGYVSLSEAQGLIYSFRQASMHAKRQRSFLGIHTGQPFIGSREEGQFGIGEGGLCQLTTEQDEVVHIQLQFRLCRLDAGRCTTQVEIHRVGAVGAMRY